MSSLSFFTQQTNVLWSHRHCNKSVTAMLWPVMLHQRLYLKQNNKNNKTAGTESASNFCVCECMWRNYVGVFRPALGRLTLHVLRWKYPKNERNIKTRLTLASNRGSLGVLWTYSGSGVVLSWDLTNKNTQTSTQAHACRVTDTWLTIPRRSTQTHAVRPVRV